MVFRALKYVAVFTLPCVTITSFYLDGWMTFLPLVYAFGIIPVLDFISGENHGNLSQDDKFKADRYRMFDWLVYLTIPVQVGTLLLFFREISQEHNELYEVVGKTLGMGMMCGVIGVNVAHELGHRTKKGERFLAKILLASTSFLHFYIEHNRGHHKNVGTPNDPASAFKNESVYRFWLRTFPGSFLSAWNIVKTERQRKKLKVWAPGNELLQYLAAEVTIFILIYVFFGGLTLICFLAASLIGMLLLETVNYIEHYGLQRKKVNEFRYEDVAPVHSWNSDFVIGRLVLFELTRHSDHHYEPSKHYQLLDSMPTASQLPAGYPAMMLLSLVPPLWFRVMNPRLP
jgi:alkane 1-monooxygenase